MRGGWTIRLFRLFIFEFGASLNADAEAGTSGTLDPHLQKI